MKILYNVFIILYGVAQYLSKSKRTLFVSSLLCVIPHPVGVT